MATGTLRIKKNTGQTKWTLIASHDKLRSYKAKQSVQKPEHHLQSSLLALVSAKNKGEPSWTNISQFFWKSIHKMVNNLYCRLFIAPQSATVL